MTNSELATRLEQLTRRAGQLRSRARLMSGEEDDDTLWMSSLDIIDELLNTMQGLIQQAGPADSARPDNMLMLCPHCHHTVSIHSDAVAAAVAVCPVCGDAILLTNPT